MKPSPFRPFILAIAGLALASAGLAAPPARITEDFDPGWRFLKADAAGAESPGFDDSSWRPQNLPHDWGIEGPFDAKNPAGGAGAFLPAGTGWYRKHFTLAQELSGKRVFVEFDGVMANSDVWINGVPLGHRPYGYISFGYELTGHLHFGSEANILAVRADNAPQPASRWYAGAGIYRHVRLLVTSPVHLEKWGTVVTTEEASASRASVRVRTTVQNQSGASDSIRMAVKVIGPDGRTVAASVSDAVSLAAGGDTSIGRTLEIPQPHLWNLELPVLYHAEVEVSDAQGTLDNESIPFGIRKFAFDSETGFSLNGTNIKLKGVCLHDDASAFGAAVPLSVWRLRLAALKRIGANAIRTAHNPPSPEFLDLCDQMGLLVMDEAFDCWTVAKNPYDYHLYFDQWSKIDARDMVRRDRNHPSIVLWSAGNEIHDTPQADKAKRILSGLVSVFHENDPTRPVTQALFRPNVSHDYDDGLADLLDVIGTNYRFNELLAAQVAKPSRKIVGTENGHELPAWLAVRDNPGYSGEFIWSGIDYLGETRVWPEFSRPTGLLDRLAQPHADGSIARSWWTSEPMVWVARRVAPTPPRPTDPGYEVGAPRRLTPVLYSDWTPSSQAAHDETVEVYSNCQSIELFLNGRSLGAQSTHSDLSPLRWKIPFAPGQLRAVASTAGKPVTEAILRTAGAPARIQLTSDRTLLPNDWDDVAMLTAVITDQAGTPVPSAKNRIRFSVEGSGSVAAVDSANDLDTEPFQASERAAFHGLCAAFVRATGSEGKITVSASSDGLAPATLVLSAAPGDAR